MFQLSKIVDPMLRSTIEDARGTKPGKARLCLRGILKDRMQRRHKKEWGLYWRWWGRGRLWSCSRTLWSDWPQWAPQRKERSRGFPGTECSRNCKQLSPLESKLQESAPCILHCGMSRAWNTACPEQIRRFGEKGLSLQTRLEGEGTG